MARLLTTTAAALLLAGGFAAAQTTDSTTMTGDTSGQATAAFRTIDADGDGSVDMDEWNEAPVGQATDAGDTFTSFDANGDEAIDEDEFQTGFAGADEDTMGRLVSPSEEIEGTTGPAPELNDAMESGATRSTGSD